jgi:hypothetical protein
LEREKSTQNSSKGDLSHYNLKTQKTTERSVGKFKSSPVRQVQRHTIFAALSRAGWIVAILLADKKSPVDCAVSTGLMEYGYRYLSSFLNTHVAQLVCIELGQEQVRASQDDEQNYNCGCNNVHGCLLSNEPTQFTKRKRKWAGAA